MVRQAQTNVTTAPGETPAPGQYPGREKGGVILKIGLVLVRGLPGSGKTTLAKKIAKLAKAKHLEADMFFEKTGEYVFDVRFLREAHSWCKKEAAIALEKGIPVVVSNTFAKIWEMEDYFVLGAIYKKRAPVVVIKTTGEFDSVHVTKDFIAKKREQWQDFPEDYAWGIKEVEI